MISFYTSHINSLMMATMYLKFVVAVYNCHSAFVCAREQFLLLLCILEAQWGYHIINRHDLIYCLKFWKSGNLKYLMHNDPYRGRTTPLTSKVTFYIFIQQIYVLNILNLVYTVRFFLFKMQFVL